MGSCPGAQKYKNQAELSREAVGEIKRPLKRRGEVPEAVASAIIRWDLVDKAASVFSRLLASAWRPYYQ